MKSKSATYNRLSQWSHQCGTVDIGRDVYAALWRTRHGYHYTLVDGRTDEVRDASTIHARTPGECARGALQALEACAARVEQPRDDLARCVLALAGLGAILLWALTGGF